jgi:nitrate reductase gamma subunit
MPYFSISILIGGLIYRTFKWLKVPVPLKIPTTPSSEKSSGVIAKVFSEIALFRGLLKGGKKLWAGALLYHLTLWSILLYKTLEYLPPIFIGLTNGFINFSLESWLRTTIVTQTIGYIGIFLSGSILFLLFRRLIIPALRYISKFSDYLILILILSIALTGTYMRVYTQLNLSEVVSFIESLASFNPTTPPTESFFLIHFFLIQILMIYTPFSKVTHFIGIILSPTRNQKNNPRKKRHQNPWDHPVEIERWEDYAKKYELE